MDRSHGRVQVHEKIIQALALTTLPDNTYDDDNNGGPLKPGFCFYKWMMLGPPLQLPIAETYLCHRRGGVTCLRTDPSTVINGCDDCSLLSIALISMRDLLTCLLFSILHALASIIFLQSNLSSPNRW